jgi:hypothetical protein
MGIGKRRIKMNLKEAMEHVDNLIEDKDVKALDILIAEERRIEEELTKFTNIRNEHKNNFVTNFSKKFIDRHNQQIYMDRINDGNLVSSNYIIYFLPVAFFDKYKINWQHGKRKSRKLLSENSIKYDNLFRKFYNLDKTVHIAWAVDVHDDLRYKLTNIIYTPPEISEKEKKLKNDLKDLQEKCTKLQKHLFYRKCDNIRSYLGNRW